MSSNYLTLFYDWDIPNLQTWNCSVKGKEVLKFLNNFLSPHYPDLLSWFYLTPVILLFVSWCHRHHCNYCQCQSRGNIVQYLQQFIGWWQLLSTE